MKLHTRKFSEEKMTAIHENDQAFQLQAYGARPGYPNDFHCIVIVEKSVTKEMVQAAWSNAVRYTAKGLDLPDHELAIKRLQERHPKWVIIRSLCYSVNIDLTVADNDIAENT
jgi:hypothetical protein